MRSEVVSLYPFDHSVDVVRIPLRVIDLAETRWIFSFESKRLRISLIARSFVLLMMNSSNCLRMFVLLFVEFMPVLITETGNSEEVSSRLLPLGRGRTLRSPSISRTVLG